LSDNKTIIPNLLVALFLILSMGCAHKRFKDDTIKTKYQCENGFEFISEMHKDQGRDQVIVDMNGDLYVLDIIPSASGLKYSDGVNTFWTKGDNAMLELADKTEYKECRTVK